MMISEHISMREATKSMTAVRLGIDNHPKKPIIENMKLVAEKIFEPVRNHFGVPIGISSFYRSQELNKAIGGSKTSEHCFGFAIDIDADIYGQITNKDIFFYIMDNLQFNQLIWEFGDVQEPAWIHASYKPEGNKNQVLQANRLHGSTIYVPWS